MKFGKTKHHFNRQFLTGIISLLIFILTFVYLKSNNLIPEKREWLQKKQSVSKITNYFNTDIKIATNTQLSGKVISLENREIKYWDPISNKITSLIKLDQDLKKIGVLNDKRLYFLVADKNALWNNLYIQNQDSFDKWVLPLENIDRYIEPVVSPDGKYVVFVSARKAKDNHFNKALYIYELANQNLKKVGESSFADIGSPFFSPRGNLIGFSYQGFENGEKVTTRFLGLYISDTSNVNLFPKVIVNGGVNFSQDGSYILVGNGSNVDLFDVAKGKIISSFNDYQLGFVNADGVIGLISNVININNTNKCTIDKTPSITQKIDLFHIKEGTLVKFETIDLANKDLTFEGLNLNQNISLNRKQFIAYKFEEKNCRKELVWINTLKNQEKIVKISSDNIILMP